jgi:hypothetical protein
MAVGGKVVDPRDPNPSQRRVHQSDPVASDQDRPHCHDITFFAALPRTSCMNNN